MPVSNSENIKHTNIDINDSKLNSNYPFTWGCNLTIGDIDIPSNLFTSIKVYLSEKNIAPCRLYSLSSKGVAFADANNNIIGYWNIFKSASGSGFIYNDTGIIKGHVVADASVPVIFKSILSESNSTIVTEDGSFTLLPQCHTTMFEGVCRSIMLNEGKSVTRGIARIIANDSIIMNKKNGDVYISIYNEYNEASIPADAKGNGVGLVIVTYREGNSIIENKYNTTGTGEAAEMFPDLKNRHLLIKHKDASNLRVLVEDNKIIFKGVLDDGKH